MKGMKSEKMGEICSKHKFDFIFARLIELLNFSIKTKYIEIFLFNLYNLNLKLLLNLDQNTTKKTSWILCLY